MNKRHPHPGKILRALMDNRGPEKAPELARRTGVPQPTIHRILTGQSVDPTNRTLHKLAKYYRLTVAQLRGEAPIDLQQPLAGYNIEPAPDPTPVPVVSWVQAGRTQPVSDPHPAGEGETAVYTTKRIGHQAYALRIRGDSMENPGGKPTFPDGCIIVVDPDKQADVGSFVVVRFDSTEEATFKQLVEDAGQRYLKPLNPRYPMIPINSHATICGTWVQTIIDSD